MQMKPTRSSLGERRMPHNRRTGRKKALRTEANRAYRRKSHHLMREINFATKRLDTQLLKKLVNYEDNAAIAHIEALIDHINDLMSVDYWD